MPRWWPICPKLSARRAGRHRKTLLECRLGFEGDAPIITSANYRVLARVVATLLMAWVSAAHPATPVWDADSPSHSHYAEDTPWTEQGVQLPAYPDDNHLVQVPVQVVGSDLGMFIDESTLTIGEDGVVRYVLVMRAPRGAENVYFEGIRCATHELRSYAYGTSQSAWQTVDAAWESIQSTGMGRYREQLYRYYLCRPAMGTLTRREMLQRMRYGVPGDD